MTSKFSITCRVYPNTTFRCHIKPIFGPTHIKVTKSEIGQIAQWARGPVFRAFASGLEAWRCLEEVLMHSSGLCHYQMKYFRAPLMTSSTRHVHKTTRRPPEDQSSWRLQVDLKHECALKMSWCVLYGYDWIRLQNVIFMQEDQIGSYYKLI